MYHFVRIQSPNGAFSDERRWDITHEYPIGISTSKRWILTNNKNTTGDNGRGTVSVRCPLEEFNVDAH